MMLYYHQYHDMRNRKLKKVLYGVSVGFDWRFDWEFD